MAGTFLCPNTCGFGKIVALELSRKVGNSLPREKGEGNTKYHARLLQEQYNQFKSFFNVVEENFDIDFRKFTKKLPSLRDAINKWNYRKAEEKTYLDTFSCANCQKLPDTRKRSTPFQTARVQHYDMQIFRHYFQSSLQF